MHFRSFWVIAALFASVIVFTGASGIDAEKSKYVRPDQIPFPKDNPYTPNKAALGKALFFDPRLSGNEDLSCASCHNPSFGWESSSVTNTGAQKTRLGRNSPTVLNTAWQEHYFWDGRAKTAEEQARGPIEADVEMNLPMREAVRRLKNVDGYVDWFDQVFPGQGITEANIVKAIATFERTVVASHAPFDRWVEGDERAISEAAKRGFELFIGKAKCADCHGGWNFTDHKFHDIGTTFTDLGRYAVDSSSIKNKFAFKTPTLRDTAQRAPYMHNGQWDTLEAVMVHYISGGLDRPSRSNLMRPLQLTDNEVKDLVEFMKTLTGEKKTVPLPILPN